MKLSRRQRAASTFDAPLFAAVLVLTAIGLVLIQTATRDIRAPFKPTFFFLNKPSGFSFL